MDAVTSPQYSKIFAQARHTVTAPQQGLYELTGDIRDWAEANSLSAGLLHGRYPSIFLFEHRRAPRPREIVLHFEGQ